MPEARPPFSFVYFVFEKCHPVKTVEPVFCDKNATRITIEQNIMILLQKVRFANSIFKITLDFQNYVLAVFPGKCYKVR